ncbi:hypothetical protein ACS5NO_10340 [Larkinella sp. GY13]|uniref:hypothetical protein n=1 Tax=Larkinella sp. GY13 TaxID=3453720 RepID=UPI003EF01C34
MTTLTEIIFKGISSILNFSFLADLLIQAKDVRFHAPDVPSTKNFEKIINIFNSDNYIDLVITTDNLNINGKYIPKVFINLGRNNEEFEILFYFDLKDLRGVNLKENIDFLKDWCYTFKNQYNFTNYVCQIDNAGEEEYYFNNAGLGSLYKKISQQYKFN